MEKKFQNNRYYETEGLIILFSMMRFWSLVIIMLEKLMINHLTLINWFAVQSGNMNKKLKRNPNKIKKSYVIKDCTRKWLSYTLPIVG